MVRHTSGLGSLDKKHNELKQLKWLNSQTSKRTVKKKLQMVETAIQHKIQSSWVGSNCSYWRNSTKSLIRSKSMSNQTSETVKLKNTEGTELLNWLISSQIWAFFRSVTLNKFFACLQLITLIWALFHLLRYSVIFVAKLRFSQLFLHKIILSFIGS